MKNSSELSPEEMAKNTESHTPAESNKELFADFLSSGGASNLAPREEKVARLLTEGKTYREISEQFDVTEERIKKIVNRIRTRIGAEDKKLTRAAELDSLLINLQESGKPLPEIPIDGIFPVRVENSLLNIGCKTLGDIVAKSQKELLRTKGISRVGFTKINEVLGRFGVRLPSE
ncbi:MAG: LuxR C-terminal-related transcriptional regulator [Candidatus Parcubacteria bacterium]|nr:LuxR C-terminal-related transcriptional regulator [Candidatus Parcubacteria bacterium]